MPGPKRKPSPAGYSPSGKRRKPTADMLNEMQRQKDAEIKRVVLDQPHRRDSVNPESPWNATALGRYCLAYKVRQELFEAGEAYAAIVRRYRAAKGIPTDSSTGEGGGGDGPSAATVAGWERQLAICARALETCPNGTDAFRYTRQLVIDDFDIDPLNYPPVVLGLQALAQALGMPLPRRPFL